MAFRENSVNRELAAAVLEALQETPSADVRRRLASFDEADWLRSHRWLHTSGLALHLLHRVRERSLEDALPQTTLNELVQRHSENRLRMRSLFDEFVRINVEFQRAGICYANLKGFSLAPRACADPSYRYQHDLDFLVSPYDAELCCQVVRRLGYRLKHVSNGSFGFVAGSPEVLSMKDLYRVRSERSLEIHFASAKEQTTAETYGDRLSRLQLQVWNGFEFPALSDSDKLVGQARHLFRHLQSEWTRVAWMLEYANAIRSHVDDAAFWDHTVELIEQEPQRTIGIGLATLIAARAFETPLPKAYQEATIERLPHRVRLWTDRYQDDVVFAEHPGSKLYLLLQDVLAQELPDSSAHLGRKLIPLHLPPRVAVAKHGSDLWTRFKAFGAQARFVWGRLCFHLVGGVRYKIESSRWKRLVSQLQTIEETRSSHLPQHAAASQGAPPLVPRIPSA